jgi:hypothetical protein
LPISILVGSEAVSVQPQQKSWTERDVRRSKYPVEEVAKCPEGASVRKGPGARTEEPLHIYRFNHLDAKQFSRISDRLPFIVKQLLYPERQSPDGRDESALQDNGVAGLSTPRPLCE